jgi:hypothetical protein
MYPRELFSYKLLKSVIKKSQELADKILNSKSFETFDNRLKTPKTQKLLKELFEKHLRVEVMKPEPSERKHLLTDEIKPDISWLKGVFRKLPKNEKALHSQKIKNILEHVDWHRKS